MNNYLQVRRYSGIAATHFLMDTNWTQSTINTAVLTDFNLLIRENIHADVHLCLTDNQMICISIYVAYTDQSINKTVS